MYLDRNAKVVSNAYGTQDGIDKGYAILKRDQLLSILAHGTRFEEDKQG